MMRFNANVLRWLPTAMLGTALFMLCLVGFLPQAMAQPGPGPGPSGGGPPDPPRDTPGLDPATLAAIAASGYGGYQYYKFKSMKPKASSKSTEE